MIKVFLLLVLATVALGQDLNAVSDRKGNKLWRDRGGTSGRDLTIYEPVRPGSNYYLLGQRAQPNYYNMDRAVHSFRDESRRRDSLTSPVGFSFIWDDRGSTYFDDASVWRPLCPRGYVALGDFLALKNRVSQPPSELFEKVRCVADDLVDGCEYGSKVWSNSGTSGSYYISMWPANARGGSFDSGFFYANNQHNEQPNVRPWCLKNRAVRET